jgi:predicted dehydrogenase
MHMRQLAQVEGARMVAFCDAVQEKSRAAAKTYGGRVYADHRKMFDGEELDAVYVCVPPFAHGDPEIRAAERGLALFVEKPIATTLEKAEEIRSAISRNGVINAVGYHWRYTAAAERARKLIGKGPVGFALGSWIGGMPGVAWWRVMKQSGGQMVEQTTHIFDLARYLLGEVVEVHAFGRTGLLSGVPNYDVHDASLANLRFKSGAVASLASSCMVQAGGKVGLDVYLQEKVLRISNNALEVVERGHTESFQGPGDPYLKEDRAFVEAVASGKGSGIRSSYADALKTLKVTLAANRSIAEGRPVAI